MLSLEKLLVRACAATLQEMYAQHKATFLELFLRRRPVSDLAFGSCNLQPLIRAKIIELSGKKIRPILRVFPVQGRFIVSDYFTPRHPDNVLPVALDESIYMENSLDVHKGDVTLDVFTGSGIYPIFAAAKARHAVGVDINPKAINYSKFNAILNGVEDKTEFLLGDMFEPVNGRKFDLITANPPYVLIPPHKTRTDALHAESTGDGLDIPKLFIAGVDTHLTSGGRVQMITGSVGNETIPEISFITERYRGKHKKVIIDFLHQRKISLGTFLRRKFATDTKFYHAPISKSFLQKWELNLRQKGYTNYYFYLITIQPARRFEIVSKQHKFQIRKDYYLTTDMSDFSLSYITRLMRAYERYFKWWESHRGEKRWHTKPTPRSPKVKLEEKLRACRLELQKKRPIK
ncbi:MAG: hypothetical protein UW63_C0058G0013 [Candidatus Uhrbacteria bacterium GW2011_GWF2_44_350]|uniref:Methyltransferase domain-containing protein n=1 Tax=Candidatus Uhrbacteria bacterium GW2011_GWF2_44_350 TaxID=1619000 RepID=A0A0G1JDL2_9BACT|nr:MAG: hypothetical protein UW63_C0058G0013 [Candidatus Uhrbacteria bacterium GW2011_GWF2_44_350]HBR80582.1 hypothetical protein [Candidatus Uhrbacteria bacterium]HCU32116.1 hypothetical protein [Candidatus Uhrbacteria bacterium]